MSKNKKVKKTPEAPKTKDLRITDMQYDLILQAEKALAEPQAVLANVMTGIFAAHSTGPTRVVKMDKDDDGWFLVVQE